MRAAPRDRLFVRRSRTLRLRGIAKDNSESEFVGAGESEVEGIGFGGVNSRTEDLDAVEERPERMDPGLCCFVRCEGDRARVREQRGSGVDYASPTPLPRCSRTRSPSP